MSMYNPVRPRPVGELVREWRARRRRSQLDLALAVGVSSRHMSFVETGRSRPSPATLLAMAEELQVPLRERNAMLLAAGYAPRFRDRPLDEPDAPDMQAVRSALQRVLDAHHPYPGVVLDRQWNIVLANGAAQALVARLPSALTTPQLNIFRIGLHPEGLAAITSNFDDWGRYMLRQLARLLATDEAPGCKALQQEVLNYHNVKALLAQPRGEEPMPTLLVPCLLELPVGRVSMFTTLTRLGTPLEVTLDELCVELFYPSDETSAARLRQLAMT